MPRKYFNPPPWHIPCISLPWKCIPLRLFLSRPSLPRSPPALNTNNRWCSRVSYLQRARGRCYISFYVRILAARPQDVDPRLLSLGQQRGREVVSERETPAGRRGSRFLRFFSPPGTQINVTSSLVWLGAVNAFADNHVNPRILLFGQVFYFFYNFTSLQRIIGKKLLCIVNTHRMVACAQKRVTNKEV